MNCNFKLGKVVITPNAEDVLDISSIDNAIERHIHGDWGDLCEADNRANEYALKHGERLLSSYRDANSIKFWIITEHDRSYTTILLLEDY